MHDDERKRQLMRLRTALTILGEETGDTRTRAADVAFYDAWGIVCGLERISETQVGASVLNVYGEMP